MKRVTSAEALLMLLLIACLIPPASAAYCTEEVRDEQLEAHVSVSSCRNIGTFSVGGYYNGTWEKLTYAYPKPWEGTFISVYVDGKTYSNSANPSSVRLNEALLMDNYLTQPPNASEGRIRTRWTLPGDVAVEEVFTLVENGTLIELLITNRNKKSVAVGLRLTLDTMLGANDGAPIYVPGGGLKSNETEYKEKSLDFGYWKAYNQQENATVMASGLIYGEDLTYPDRFVIADWKKSMYTSWDYRIDENRTILGDSSVLIYYNPTILSPGETRRIATAYKNGGPVVSFANRSIAIADIVTDIIEGEYLPGDDVNMSVDLIAKDAENATSILVNVTDAEGNVVYEKNVTIAQMRPDVVYSIDLSFKAPAGFAGGEPLSVNATLYSGGERVDAKSRVLLTAEKRRQSFRIRDVQITGSYAEGFSLGVEVANTKYPNEGQLQLTILDAGAVVQESTKATGVVPQYSRKTVEFTWKPEKKMSESLYAVVSLHQGEVKLDELSKQFPSELLSGGVPTTKRTATTRRTHQEEDSSNLQWLLIPAAVLMIAYAAVYMRRRLAASEVSFDKMREGGSIVLIVKNRRKEPLRDCTVEDTLPEGIEVSISDFHIIGHGNRIVVGGRDKLIWHIGTLDAGDTAVMEYRMVGSSTLLPARLRWSGGAKKS